MTGRTKCRTMQNNKWTRKEYIQESDSDIEKYVIKISSHTYCMATED